MGCQGGVDHSPEPQLRGGRADRLHVQNRIVRINKGGAFGARNKEDVLCALLLSARTTLAACGSGVVVDETDDAVVAVAVD